MSLTKDIKFEPWDIDLRIIQVIQQLKNTMVRDNESVHVAIQSLETLGRILEAEIKKTEILLNENDKDYLFDIYWKFFGLLKDNEGADFCLTSKSLKTCLGFLQLFFFLIVEGWSHLDHLVGFEIPEEVREAITTITK